jgi:hypothetical protein
MVAGVGDFANVGRPGGGGFNAGKYKLQLGYPSCVRASTEGGRYKGEERPAP